MVWRNNMRINLICFIFIMIYSLYAEDINDFRPPLDKKGYERTVWSQVNPWFPMNKARIHSYGGPNFSHKLFRGPDIWGQGMKVCDQYGLNGWQVEINEPNGWINTYRKMLEEAEKVHAKQKLGMFFGFYSKTPEDSLKAVTRILGTIRKELKDSSYVARINGRPVLVIYNPLKFTPEQWKLIFDGLDKEFGPFVYLANTRVFSLASRGKNESLIQYLRSYMPYFDGLSNYGSSGISDQKRSAEIVGAVMHKEFPHKIYEGCVHSTYTCHFHMGGLEVHLSKEYRESFDIIFKADPDSISITNLFDHYENSLIFPCYEREDLLMRYMHYRIAKWRGSEFPAMSTPELVLTNYNMVLLGWQNLDFEIIGFPIRSSSKEVTVQLDLCNTAGKVLRSFPPRSMLLDGDVKVETFSVPSTDFALERGIVPRLIYQWRGKTYKMNYNPMTLISPSIRSYRMYWARSTRNALQVRNGEEPWTLGTSLPGGTLPYPKSGISNFQAYVLPVWGQSSDTKGYLQHSIKRNGMEFYTTSNYRHYLNMNFALELPKSNGTLNFYHLEMENAEGSRWQSLPVWVAAESRSGTVKIPVWKEDGAIHEYEVEKAWVPYFYYPCDTDNGNLLVDVSGYMHNGNINGSGYGGGHLGYTGYYYYHNGPIPSAKTSIFRKEPDGRGLLHFSGKDYVMIMGGTAFPGASTYELQVRPAQLGKVMGLLGSGNNQISLAVLPDGRLKAERRSETEGMGGNKPGRTIQNEVVSKDKLSIGKWSSIVVVYNLKKLSLYLNGKLEGEVESVPIRAHEWINHLIVGASNKWVWNPVNHFEGDIREIRIYGRNLSESEFLR